MDQATDDNSNQVSEEKVQDTPSSTSQEQQQQQQAGDENDDRKKVAILAMQKLVKQRNEATTVPDWVEAPEIPRPEDETPSGRSRRQIEERMRNVAEKAATGMNTTAMGIGMRDLGFAISKSRGDIDNEQGQAAGGRINVKAIAKKAETVVARKLYTYEDLKTKDLPGVPKNAKEEYLNDEEFPVVFGMERQDFERLPMWRRQNLKQKAGLF